MTKSNLFLNLFRGTEGTSYAAGQTIVEAGTKGETMYIVLDGEVEVRISDKKLETGSAGTIFGEMALIDNDPRSATVVAKTDCRVVEIGRKRFEFLVSETPYFA